MHAVKRNGESELEQKLLTPAGWDNGIKTDILLLLHPVKKICTSNIPNSNRRNIKYMLSPQTILKRSCSFIQTTQETT